MSKDLTEHYRVVLNDLQQRRVGYVNAINELDGMIAGINRQIQLLGTLPAVTQREPANETLQFVSNAQISANRYTNMSVRWAVLNLLAEDAKGPMTTGEVAEALQAGGVKSEGQRFNSITSAVLSDMKIKKREVEVVADGRYQLTDNGREAWAHIKMTSQYRNRVVASGR